jgi:threonylcarbamoyladenosine tRNA methylthiotransferase MtaB
MRDARQPSGRPFMKMHGLGNDFVVIDQRGAEPFVTAALARALGDRHRGVGFDQLAVIEEDAEADVRLTFWNADGSSAGACGNATRCIAQWEMARRGVGSLTLRTGRGVLHARDAGAGLTAVNMGAPILDWREIPLAEDADTLHLPIEGDPVATGMGNPHCTFFVDDAEAVDLAAFGPAHEHHPLFPERTNVQVVSALGPTASGCGSGSAGRGSRSPRGRPPARWRWRRRGGGSRAFRDPRSRRGRDRGGLARGRGLDDGADGPCVRRRAVTGLPGGGVMDRKAPVFSTHGCRLNAYETEAMKELASSAGLGDAVIVNTCAVTAEAVRKARQDIRRLRREHPAARIIVTGCAAQTEPETFAAMAEVDHVIGNAEKMTPGTWGALARDFTGETEKVQVDDIMSVTETAGHLIDGFGTRSRAYVQVQNGCDHRCTFCIIPYGRGNSRSVPAGVVVDQIRRLVERGYNEVVLTGVDLTSWGADLPGAPRLGDLVTRILKLVPELPRLRISSIDSIEVDEALMAAIAGEARLMPHLHLSLQAGDDLILKRMKRRHLRDDAIRFCEEARRLRPDMTFGADIIAGFPTETRTCSQIR